MPYCPRCGVEADASVRSCPLCGTAIPRFEALGPGEPAWPEADRVDGQTAKVYATAEQKRFRGLVAYSGALGVAALAVTASDLAMTGRLTWAWWPLASLVAALAFAWPAFRRWRPRAAVPWSLVVVGVLLATFSELSPGRGWFVPLGLPLLTAATAAVALVVLQARVSARRGWNLVAGSLAAAAGLLITVDALVSQWLGVPALGWSVVTTLVLGPLALLFLVLHTALPGTPDFRRTFHF